MNEKSPGVLEIVEVDRQSALYRKFKEHSTGEAAAVAVEVPPVAEVLFSIPKRMKHLFVGQENSELMSKMEARELLLLRVKEKAMLMQEKSGWARMDEELQAALKVVISPFVVVVVVLICWLESQHRNFHECIDYFVARFVGSSHSNFQRKCPCGEES